VEFFLGRWHILEVVGVDSHQRHHVVVAVYGTAVRARVPDPDPVLDPNASALELAFHDLNPDPEALEFSKKKHFFNFCPYIKSSRAF
jgi:hypothetical protein